MAMEFDYGTTALFTKDSGLMTNRMVMEDVFLQILICMSESLKMEKWRDMENIQMMTVADMKETG